MIVSWTSNRTLDKLPRVVAWGIEGTNLSFTANAFSRTYVQQDFAKCLGYNSIIPRTTVWPKRSMHVLSCDHWECDSDITAGVLFYDPGWLHNATLGPLLPSTRYTYRVGESGDGGVMSDTFTFVSPPAVGSREDLSILYTADVGIGPRTPQENGSAVHNGHELDYGAQNLQTASNDSAPFSLMLLNGDLSYADGWLWMWERFMDSISPLASRMPLAITMGNHEIDFINNTEGAPYANTRQSRGECGITSYRRFHIPPYYSFDHGSVHFVMLNSETNLTAQKEWMKSDIVNNVNRTQTPWVIVLSHRPVYGSYSDPGEDAGYRNFSTQLLGEVFSQLKVDVVFMGHKHFYERMHPIGNVTYIIDGSGGRMDFEASHSFASNDTAYKEFGTVGYTRVRVSEGATKLTIERVHMVSKKVKDSVVLTKK